MSYQWLPEEHSLAITELVDGASAEIALYDLNTGSRRVLFDASTLSNFMKGEPICDQRWAPDGSHVSLLTDSPDGPIAAGILERSTGHFRPLQRAGSREPFFSLDRRHLSYIHDNDIWIETVNDGAAHRVTFDGSDDIANGIVDWCVSGSFESGPALVWSQDSKRIAFLRCDLSNVSRSVVGERSATTTPETRSFPYPKPGENVPVFSLLIFDLESGKTTVAKLSWQHEVAYITRLRWRDGSRYVYAQVLNRRQNQLAILSIDSSNGATEVVFEDHDDAWVEANDFHVLADGSCVVTSERDGWRRLYNVRAGSDDWKPISPAGIDVGALRYIAPDVDRILMEASPTGATRSGLYLVRPLGADVAFERVTPPTHDGWNFYDICPSGRWAYHQHSSAQASPTSQIVQLPGHSIKVKLPPHNRRYRPDGVSGEFFQISISREIALDASMLFPKGFDPKLKYPLLLYVYGGPAKAVVRDEWVEHLSQFHHKMAEDGYLVLSVDNRGTPVARGREWRKAVFGHQDTLPLHEQAAALRQLLSTRPYIDESRLAVWGHSAGGAATLHLMFRDPTLFKIGVASAAVTDRRYYCAPFQERFLGTPQENAEAYRLGSNINFADGLAGELMLIHGTADTNVHPEMCEMLSKRLIDLEKGFYLMSYPGRGHDLPRKNTAHYFRMIADFIGKAFSMGDKS